MTLVFIDYVLVFIFICFSGFVNSIAGGGGLISIPTYIAIGLPSELILGTNKFVNTCGGTISAIRYLRSGIVDFSIIKYGIFLALLGSIVGANLATVLDSEKMTYILIVVVPIIFILNHYQGKLLKPEDYSISKASMILRCSFIGFIFGGYDGFFGPGTGTFLIVALVLFMNHTLHEASASSRMINFTSNLGAFFIFLFKGVIAWEVAIVGILASLIGNYLGSSFVVKGNAKVIKNVFNFVLLGLLSKSIYDILIENI